ncbi:DUF4345 domain-containing protein [Winogradskyella sp.]|jgi:hypothetical protein|uniref:DUF4345 domain-containing protein n=1 Tax=Winogradskyella sp. TaxID=1883156 RepID=UPI0025EBD7EF|nr:DUF4345 domain-containing protein [Winogradskyella sp.]MCT4629352.1 DUF4345 domain-containing protein [Winogradskyella sp.]
MKISSVATITKIHLIISVVVVFPAAFIYGFNLGEFLNLNLNTIDEYNFNKAIMGLYIAFSMLWVSGILRRNHLKAALISNMLFMLGLGFGRIISITLDGVPSVAYVVATVGELCLGLYGLWVLNSKYLKKS